MSNVHTSYDLAQMQSLPLEAKERMSERRLQTWYESWNRYKLVNKVTGRVVYKAALEDPKLTKNQYIDEVTSGACYVSFSGGKDSTVLADLTARFCKRYGYKLVLLFVNTGLEYPEIQKHVKTFHKYLEAKYDMEIDLTIDRPEMRFDQVLTTYGYPVISKEIAGLLHDAQVSKATGYDNSYAVRKFNGTYVSKNGTTGFSVEKYAYLLDAPFNISHKCCDVMKKRPAHKFSAENGLMPILGIMANESRLRRQKWMKYGCNAFGNKRNPASQPLSFWTEQDIYEYIVKYDLPIASVYGQVVRDETTGKYTTTGATRTGCVFCLFGAHCKGDCRFLSLKETHKQLYRALFDVEYSDCYEVYGLKRTGCAGCPFGSNFEEELKVIEEYEPRLFNAVNKIFGDSYDYTRRYREFKANFKP